MILYDILARFFSASIGSDVLSQSQTSCTTEYEGDAEPFSGFTLCRDSSQERRDIERKEAERQAEMDWHSPYFHKDSISDMRFPSPAKVRWIKAYNRVKQILHDQVSTGVCMQVSYSRWLCMLWVSWKLTGLCLMTRELRTSIIIFITRNKAKN